MMERKKQQHQHQPMVIDIIDDKDYSTIVLDDDDDDNGDKSLMPCDSSAICIDDNSLVIVTSQSPRTPSTVDDNDDDIITIDDDDEIVLLYNSSQLPEVAALQPEVSALQPEVGVLQPEVRVQQPEVGVQQPEVGVQQLEVGVQQPEVSDSNMAPANKVDLIDENCKVKKKRKRGIQSSDTSQIGRKKQKLGNCVLSTANTNQVLAGVEQQLKNVSSASGGKCKKRSKKRNRKQKRLFEALKNSGSPAYRFKFFMSSNKKKSGVNDGRKDKDDEEKKGDDKVVDNDVTKRGSDEDDVILVASSLSGSSTSVVAPSSSSSMPVQTTSIDSRKKETEVWSKPPHLEQKLVGNLWAGMKESNFKTQKLVSVPSNDVKKPSNIGLFILNKYKSSKVGPSISNPIPEPLNKTPVASGSSAIVIADSSKVFKPRDKDVSRVGNNVFIPSTMPERTGPRPVFIDGCNVAFSHGRNAVFSVKGIEICVQYFKRLGNRPFVVLPNHRKGYLSDTTLSLWEKDGTLVVTPSRRINHSLVAADDDRYVIQCAAAMDGIIVTSDQYRDHMGINPLWDETIKKRLLMLTWLQDMLIFPDDPLGRHGPKLIDFLRY